MKTQNLKLKSFYKKFFLFVYTLYFILNTLYFPSGFVFAQEASPSAIPSISESPQPTPTPTEVQISQQQIEQTASSSAQQEIRIQDRLDNLSGQIIFDAQKSGFTGSSAKFKIPINIKKLSKYNFKADE